MSFRNAYKLSGKLRWFPGHMNKGLKMMQRRLRDVDCIIEVHDARVPFSGRNPEFRQSICGSASSGFIKPHILVLNKKDLTERRDQRKVIEELREREGLQHILFTNSKDQRCEGVRRVIPLANELIATSERHNRQSAKDYSIMVLGVPNVGKSSLLNRLRNIHLHRKNAAAVGSVPGVTRAVSECIKIGEDPLVYMYDTPGILEPCINDDEMGMKLALVGCVPDHTVGEEQIADYLLYWLNKNAFFRYVDMLELERPTDNIMEVLITVANRRSIKPILRKIDGRVMQMPDVQVAAKHFIKLFRTGELGKINLDKQSRNATEKPHS